MFSSNYLLFYFAAPDCFAVIHQLLGVEINDT